MFFLFNKYIAIVFLYLSACLLQAMDLKDSDSDMVDHGHGMPHSDSYSIIFENPDYSIKRTYNKNHVPTETRISSSKQFSCNTTKEVIQIISWIMDRIEAPKRHESRDFIQEHKPIEHIHRHEHPEGLIHELVNEVRGIGRDCIDAMPQPIGYFLGFWPIRPVLNRVFPHHEHKHL